MLQNVIISDHLSSRAPQRGYFGADARLVVEYGTAVQDGFILLKRDIERAVPWLFHLLKEIKKSGGYDHDIGRTRAALLKKAERLRKLERTFVPMAGPCAKSIYRPSDRKLKSLLRSEARRRPQSLRRRSR